MYSINSTATATDVSVNSASYATEAQKTQSVKTTGNTTEDTSAESQSKREEVDTAVTELNSALDSLNVQREFKVDDSTNDVVVKIIDKDDQKVIKQIPSEDAIKLSKNIKEMVGLLFDSTS